MKAVLIALVLVASIFFAHGAHATQTSTVNVTDFCSVVDGTADNTACIQNAVNSLSPKGGVLYFPCGNYKTTSTVTIPAGLIGVEGEGRCSSWNGYGNFDTLSINIGGSTYWYGNRIQNIRFAEYNKTGGATFNINHVAQFDIADVYIDAPYCGPHIHDFNDVTVRRTRIASSTGAGCQEFLLTGGGTGDPAGRSDVIDFNDVVFSGPGTSTGNYHGLIVDGNVNTVSAHKIYFTSIDGYGLWFRNSIGGSVGPAFASIYGLEADYPYGAAIFIQTGSTFHFTDPQVNGSRSNSNIYIASGASRVSIQGGFSTGANKAGIDTFGTQVSISDMDISFNSDPDQGGTAGTWSGIVLEGTSRMITVTGNKAGTPNHPTWQSYGIQVNSGADQFTVTGNVVFNNATVGVFNGAGTSSSKIVQNNAQ